MDIPQLFLERYEPLCNFYLAGIWAQVPYDLMCQRPNPEVNSIAWNLWHLARVEDAGLNRFVVDRSQVLDEGSWMERMNIPWRHHGSEMRLKDVDELDKRIDLVGLRAYSLAVQERTREVVRTLSLSDLDPVLGEARLRKIMLVESLAFTQAEGFVQNYLGWSKGKCLMSFCLTHPWQHIGEIGVIASLVGVVFE